MGHSLEATPDSMPVSIPRRDLARVYREHVPYVWRSLKHLGVLEADIEDIAHDVFLVVARKLDGFEERSSLKTWIYGICLRTAADYRKRAFRRYEQLGVESREPSTQPSQDRALARSRARARLEQVLNQLDEGKREVFVLYELEELSMSEVARIVECPLQTAYSRLHAARQAVRAAFGAELEPGDVT